MCVPVSTGREIGGIAHHAVCPPRNQVRSANRNGAAAAGADVVLQRLRARNWLDGPLAARTPLGALPPREHAIEPVAAIGLGSSAIVAGHVPSLGTTTTVRPTRCAVSTNRSAETSPTRRTACHSAQ